MRVYRIPFSTNVERVALALGHKELPVEWVDVDPDDRAPIRELSGQPLVPVLVDDSGVHIDSTAILAYLDERYPERPLYPSDEPHRSEVTIFVDWFNRVWKRPPNEIDAELDSSAPDQKRIAALREEMARSLDLFEGLLAGRDYLFENFSVADCSAFPFLKYAVQLDPSDDERFHRILNESLVLGDGYPRLRAWIGRVDAHPRA